MTACETCWALASQRAMLLGGAAADRYREVLAEHPTGHTAAEVALSTPPGSRGDA